MRALTVLRFPELTFAGAAILLSLSFANIGCGSSDGSEDGSPGVDSGVGGRPADASGGIDQRRVDASSVEDSGEPSPDSGARADAGGTQPLGSCLGVCLEAFYSQCSRSLGCTQSVSGLDVTRCYSDGVKQLLTTPDQITYTGTVRKANGDPCYQWVEVSLATEDITDPNGNLIAHIDFSYDATHVVVTCNDGSVTENDLTSPACADYYASVEQTCTTGSCAW